MDDRFEARAEKIADQERKIQAEIDAKEAKGGGEDKGAVQAGAREYPEPPFPEQHQRKPGEEAALDPAPMYDAPFWKGSGKLEGMAAIVTGGDSGIGRAVAVLFAREAATSRSAISTRRATPKTPEPRSRPRGARPSC